MTIRCPGCGHEVATATARWCGRCGARLSRAATDQGVNGHATVAAAAVTRVPVGAAATSTGDAAAAGLSGPGDLLVRGTPIDLTGFELDPVPDADPAEVGPVDDRRIRRSRIGALLVAVATVAAVLVLQPEPEVVYPPAGYAAGGEPTRSGRVSHAPLETLPSEVVWERQLNVPHRRTSIAVGPTVALEVGGDGTVGRDPDTGAQLWLRRDLHIAGEPLIGEVVAATRSDGELIGFHPLTGRTVWSRDDVRSDPLRAIPGTDLALALRGNDLAVIDTEDGRDLWRQNMRLATGLASGVDVWAAEPAGDLVLISGTSPPGLVPSHENARHLGIALDARSGEVRWVAEFPGGLEEGRSLATAETGVSAWISPRDGVTVVDGRGQTLVEGLEAAPRPQEPGVATIEQAPVESDIPFDSLGGDPPEPEEVPPTAAPEVDGSSVVSQRSLGIEVQPVSGASLVCCVDQLPGSPHVLVVTRSSVATGYDLSTGEQLWRWDPDAGQDSLSVYTSPGGGLRSVVWREDGTRELLAVDPATGRATRLDLRTPGRDGTWSWVDGRGNRFEGEGSTFRVETVAGAQWEDDFTFAPGGAPAVRDGLVVVPTTTGTLAVELEDGRVRWRVAVKSSDQGALGSRWATPAIGVTNVAASPSLGVFQNLKPTDRLAGYDVQTGVSAWSRTNDPTPPRGEVTLDDELAFLAVGREIHGYDLTTGRRAFAAKSVDGVETLAVTPTHVVGTPDFSGRAAVEASRLEAIGVVRADRSTAWRRPGSEICTPPAIARGITTDGSQLPVDVAVWGERAAVRAVDVTTGTDLWQLGGVGPVCSPLAVADGRAVFLPTFLGDDVVWGLGDITGVPLGTNIAAVDTATGSYAWNNTLPSPATTAPVISGEHVLLGLADGRIVAVSVATGEIVSETALDGIPAASPTVAEDGTLLVVLTDGRLIALR